MANLRFFLSVMFLSTLGCAQNVSLPEPPQVQAQNHVVSLTLHAVNENGRDTFLSTVRPSPRLSALPRAILSKLPTSTIFLLSLRNLVPSIPAWT